MTLPRSGSNRIAYACLALRLGEPLLIALSQTPFLRLLEENVCRNYYRTINPSVIGLDDSVPEERCKTVPIQSELSHINGLATVISLLPTVLAALPYLLRSRFNDKRRTLLINSCGALLSNVYYSCVLYFYNVFDPRWIWLQGLFSFVGGGDLVYYALLQALIAESVDHSILSSFYIYSSAAALVITVLGSAASLSIMKFSLWLPVVISLGLKVLDIPIILIFLGGLGKDSGYMRVKHIEASSPEDNVLLGDEEANSSINESIEKEISLWDGLEKQRVTFLKYIFPLVMIALQELGNSLRVILPYWMSKRYGWTLRGGGWVQLGITLLNTVVVSCLPRLSTWLQKRQGSDDSKARDLNLSRMCLGFSSIGITLLGFSWHGASAMVSLAVIAGGIVFRDAYLGYLTADMQKEEISQVYIVVEMVSLTAFSFGGWLVSDVYALCLSLGDTWQTSVPVWICALGPVTCWYLLR